MLSSGSIPVVIDVLQLPISVDRCFYSFYVFINLCGYRSLGLTDSILKKQYNTKSVYTPWKEIRNILHPPKDYIPFQHHIRLIAAVEALISVKLVRNIDKKLYFGTRFTLNNRQYSFVKLKKCVKIISFK